MINLRWGISFLIFLFIMQIYCLNVFAIPQMIPGGKVAVQKIIKLRKAVKDAKTPSEQQKVIETLIQSLKDKSKYVREEAADLLGELGAKEAEQSLNTLVEKETDWRVKNKAFYALWKIKLANAISEKEKIEVLLNALYAKLDGIQGGHLPLWATRELGNRGMSEAIPELEKVAIDRFNTDQMQDEARLAIRKIELITTSSARFEVLQKALQSTDKSLRDWAVYEFEELKDKRAIPLLKAELEKTDLKEVFEKIDVDLIHYQGILSDSLRCAGSP